MRVASGATYCENWACRYGVVHVGGVHVRSPPVSGLRHASRSEKGDPQVVAKIAEVQSQEGGPPIWGQPSDAKADGDEPVQDYIAAMPEWKSDVGRRLDDLIVRTVPNVRKAVRWNSPWYGIEGQGWFLSYHVFTRYLKVTFLNGASLRPEPPGSGKDPDARWVDIYEDELDEDQMAEWVRQSAALPGWDGFDTL